MELFPQMIYKAGGVEDIHGGKFTSHIVHDAAELDAALASGWSLSTVDALEAAKPKAEPEDDAPPTRAELEAKATELGIKFDGRTGDKKLGDLIDAKLKG